MAVSVEYFPIIPIEYPDEDGKLIAEGDIQCSYLTYTRSAIRVYFQNRAHSEGFFCQVRNSVPHLSASTRLIYIARFSNKLLHLFID